jgi:glutamate/tyrosine decarboxylase-like PLP-dependent enzyme
VSIQTAPEPPAFGPPVSDPPDAAPPAFEAGGGSESTLDPTTDRGWQQLEALGHRAVTDLVSYLRTLRHRPPWRPVPAEVKGRLSTPVPRAGSSAEQVYEELLRDVLPYPTGNLHPRFWGWVKGTGVPVAMFAELIAAAMNSHVAGYDDSASLVEDQVLEWCKALLGFPSIASGVLVSGGSTANLIGLAVARSVGAGVDVRRHGVAGGPRLVGYCSTETHACVVRAFEVLGLGSEALRRIPVTSEFRMELPALRAAIARDRALGHRPFCIVGNAGTVNTAAVDDLAALGTLADEQRLWLHIDGALGAFARISPLLAPPLEGLERADSLAFDLHKWLYLPYEIGCVLVRSAGAHRDALRAEADYLAPQPRGVASRTELFSDLELQRSRGFRALKAWMALKTHGVESFARLIEQNHRQCLELEQWARAEPELEVATPVVLNVVCLRYVGRGGGVPAAGPGGDGDEGRELRLDQLNRELLYRLQEQGIAVPSSTVLRGRFWLRVCVVNHRSRREDFRVLLDALLTLGRELSGSP